MQVLKIKILQGLKLLALSLLLVAAPLASANTGVAELESVSAQTNEQLCEDTGGSWSGIDNTCTCPVGQTFDTLLGCRDLNDEELCEDTGGSWSGIDNTCTCPVGQTFGSSGCAVETSSGIEEIDDRPRCEDGTLGTELSDGSCIQYDEEKDPLENNPIFVILGRIIQFLLASVGLGLTAVVVIAGYQYMTAHGDPQKTASAKQKIAFAVVGVIMYVFAAALMNWLVPGGLIP